MQLRTSSISALLLCFIVFTLGLENDRRKGQTLKVDLMDKGAGLRTNAKEVKPNTKAKEVALITKAKEERPNSKVKGSAMARNATKAGRDKVGTVPKNDAACASVGGICQRSTYICQGRYLKDKCSGPKTRQCCTPGPAAWHPLCSSHPQNRVRACDRFGCGAFNSKRRGKLHKAVDVVCDDYAVVNAPFSGTLDGPVGRRVGSQIQYDGVKLSNSEFCVKIFHIRPYRYTGKVTQGQALGYLLPLQESFSGITSHLELQMCDRSDPSQFI
ncbi:hypothetical protein AGOR_G00023260 [Albula goreensis]|uniref:Uncharacterized protein n=1 Tax=Albula goreensis TaxID=1534307 RepID=A0A8T3E459_9TELE|nr:hypothetical protein AGOR_G00023260 [Albula goreensis]